ncbi:hypothetical protein VTI74DRAFT_2026 [Chaetomium olivicolor]
MRSPLLTSLEDGGCAAANSCRRTRDQRMAIGNWNRNTFPIQHGPMRAEMLPSTPHWLPLWSWEFVAVQRTSRVLTSRPRRLRRENRSQDVLFRVPMLSADPGSELAPNLEAAVVDWAGAWAVVSKTGADAVEPCPAVLGWGNGALAPCFLGNFQLGVASVKLPFFSPRSSGVVLVFKSSNS